MSRITQKLALVFAIVLGASLIGAATADAVVFHSAAGAHGYWGGSERQNRVMCVEHQRVIMHAGPWFTRTSVYPYSAQAQTIWVQPRLERWNGAQYYVDTVQGWLSFVTNPGQVAWYRTNWNQGDFNINVSGVYRVTYDVRWYVAGRQVGSAVFGHHDSEIVIDWGGASRGGAPQQIIANGCTMNTGITWVG